MGLAMKYLRTQSAGFTLIETLVAITILLVAMAGPMTIAARGLQNSFYAREQVTAYSLGQEAIEFVRAVRDGNALTGDAWLDGIPASCDRSNTEGCGMDIRTSEFYDCAASSDTCTLNYDTGALSGNRGFYTYELGNQTIFTRRMWVDEVVADQETEVTVEVSWASNLFGGDRTVTLQSRIFNHYDSL